MKAYQTITWVLDDEGKLVRPGGIARLGSSSLAKLGSSVNPEPVKDDAPLTDEEKAALLKIAAVEAAQSGEEPTTEAMKPEAAQADAQAAAGASTTDPARKEPEANPAKAKGDAGKGSK